VCRRYQEREDDETDIAGINIMLSISIQCIDDDSDRDNIAPGERRLSTTQSFFVAAIASRNKHFALSKASKLRLPNGVNEAKSDAENQTPIFHYPAIEYSLALRNLTKCIVTWRQQRQNSMTRSKR
jgi:hypothetical protein